MSAPYLVFHGLRFGLFSETSRSIGKTLALDAKQRTVGARNVVNAQLDTV
jgi:hypothetical protein